MIFVYSGLSLTFISVLGLIILDAKWGIKDLISFKTGKGRRIKIDTSILENDIITGSKTTGFFLKTNVSDKINPMDITSVTTGKLEESVGFTDNLEVDDEVTGLLQEDLTTVIEEIIQEDELTHMLSEDGDDYSEDKTDLLQEVKDLEEVDLFSQGSLLNNSSELEDVYETTGLLDSSKDLFTDLEVTEVIEETGILLEDDDLTSILGEESGEEETGRLSSDVLEPKRGVVTVLFDNINTENIEVN